MGNLAQLKQMDPAGFHHFGLPLLAFRLTIQSALAGLIAEC